MNKVIGKEMLRSVASVGCVVTMMSVAIPAEALTASIAPGVGAQDSPFITSKSSVSFQDNQSTVVGGSGIYTYAWTETDDGVANWFPKTAASASIVPRVFIANNCDTSQSTFALTVSDTATGQQATSNPASYYVKLQNGGICP